MTLTSGRGPLSGNPAGRFDPPIPNGVVYVEPHLRRVRGLADDGRVLIDSEHVLLVHRPEQPPTYAFPAGDVHGVAHEDEPAAPGHVRVAPDAVARWFEEEEAGTGKPRNPYHRVDCLRGRRRLLVEVADTALVHTVLVDTDDVMVVCETSLPPRLYVHPDHVRTDLLSPSDTTTYCPYKGTASYWNVVIDGTVVADAAWSYEDPFPESLPIAGHLSFYEDGVTVTQNLPASA